MATLWCVDSGGTRYEVREHGSTRRLFSDGVFHSAWNDRTGLTGRAWDLFLPAACALPAPPQRVLVLGIGAGAVLLQYRRFIDPPFMLGVDLDPVHLDIGRRFFGLDRVGATLVQADARDWVAAWDGPQFDLVIEDLYGHADGEPCRAVAIDAAWAAALARLLAPRAALVINFTSVPELRASAPLRFPAARAGYASGFMLRGPKDDNAVAVFCRDRATPAAIRMRARAVPGLDDRRRGCRLRYGIRTLW